MQVGVFLNRMWQRMLLSVTSVAYSCLRNRCNSTVIRTFYQMLICLQNVAVIYFSVMLRCRKLSEKNYFLLKLLKATFDFYKGSLELLLDKRILETL